MSDRLLSRRLTGVIGILVVREGNGRRRQTGV